jgi:hypothetical protein
MQRMPRHRRREKKLYLAFLEILRNWWWILILAIATFVVFSIYNALHSEDTARATLVLRYEKAYEGLNPNGSRFNINDLLNDEVLTKAISLAGLDGKLTTNQLQKSISLDSSGSQNPKNKYIATEYTVILSNKYLPSTISARSMLGIVMQCYKTFFLDHYGRNDGVLDIDWSETEVWEYLEFADIMGVKFNNIITYLEALQTESGTYNFQTEGETFQSLADSIAAFRDINLNKFTAFVTNNNLFRNAENYRDKMNYRRFLVNQDSAKNTERYNIYQDALTMYDKAMISFVLVPVYDSSNGLRVARTSNGMDSLTDSSLKYAKQIETNAKELKLFDDSIERTYIASTDPEIFAIADQMIEDMKENLDALIDRISSIVQTYEESRFKNSISIKISSIGVIDGYKVKDGLILAIFVGLFVCAWYGIQGIIKGREKKA